MGDPNGDLSTYLGSLSPTDLLGRYQYIAAGGQERRDKELYGQQDINNQFAYDLAKKTLQREPTPGEIIAGPGVITASNVANILAATQAPPSSNVDPSGNVPAPATSSPGSMTFDSAGPGGTPLSFASQYSYGGQAPTTFTAPPVGQPGNVFLLVLAGAALYFLLAHKL